MTPKDLEDLINLIRVAINAALQEMRISRAKANDLQRVEKILPGSIDIVTALSERTLKKLNLIEENRRFSTLISFKSN